MLRIVDLLYDLYEGHLDIQSKPSGSVASVPSKLRWSSFVEGDDQSVDDDDHTGEAAGKEAPAIDQAGNCSYATSMLAVLQEQLKKGCGKECAEHCLANPWDSSFITEGGPCAALTSPAVTYCQDNCKTARWWSSQKTTACKATDASIAK